MTNACPVPTPTEHQYGKIQNEIKTKMMRKVYAALDEATEHARNEMLAAGLDLTPPSSGYLASVIYQNIYCKLCGADPDSFSGGKPDVAIAIIRNMQNIAKHHWGADIMPYPRG